jgi:hypothetical protein
MCEVKMVENYELERKIEDCKTKARWDSIDEDFLNDCEKHNEWYLNYTKKEEHPMSYQVKKEIEEWEQNEPIFNDFRNMQTEWLYLCIGYMCVIFGIGLYTVAYILS